MLNAGLVGLALMALALGAMLLPQTWEGWSEAALALWLLVSPWALGFSAIDSALFAAVGTGTVILALALWALATDSQYSAWLHHRKAR